MHQLKIALATRFLGQPIRQSLRTAAALGARGIQFDLRDELRAADLSDTGRRALLHHLEELGLSVASAVFPTRRGFSDQQQLDARVAAVRSAMEFARELRANALVVRLGRIPEKDDAAGQHLLHEVVSDLARHANQVGVSLVASTAATGASALCAFLESIRTGPVGVDFDPASVVISGERPEAALRTLHSLLLHFTARDAVREADGSGVEVPLGRGEVDWVALLPMLDEIGFTGWMTVARTQGDDRPGDLARAIQYLKNVTLG